ncbi:unnamed protein product [Vitrella brassicaformis CCMP3155]|uniref:Protein kinase domain-containing protein n=1 Tax=Vitrella brassicaformis (strain CCMP3155) TaxID=1169540 RepID=A0A0G4ESI3_VITBC|nr:unnamed protein product [Vitrella brassicaformis CCMP3155]|eukprot:CEM00878.1 unnamed protein product [Vitrella brassicaformis CCMP3155]
MEWIEGVLIDLDLSAVSTLEATRTVGTVADGLFAAIQELQLHRLVHGDIRAANVGLRESVGGGCEAVLIDLDRLRKDHSMTVRVR